MHHCVRLQPFWGMIFCIFFCSQTLGSVLERTSAAFHDKNTISFKVARDNPSWEDIKSAVALSNQKDRRDTVEYVRIEGLNPKLHPKKPKNNQNPAIEKSLEDW